MNIIDFDHVQIAAPAGCEAAARHFYGNILGFQEIAKPEPLRARGGCWFQVGPRQLHIGVAEPFQPAGKAHPAFTVNDIEELQASLERAGIACLWDGAIEARRRFYIQDPWGNRLEFIAAVRPDLS